MYLVCLRFFLISLNASHSFNNVPFVKYWFNNRGYDLRFNTLFHLRTSITRDEFWVTLSLFRFCFVKMLSIASCFVACLSI